MNNNNQDFLEHFGIPGMRWGRRKGNGVMGTPSEDHSKHQELKKKQLHEMSNDELRAFTQRIALEKQYKEATKKKPHPLKKFITDLVSTNAKAVVNQVAAAQTKKLVDELLGKAVKDKVEDVVKDKVKQAATDHVKKKAAQHATKQALLLLK